jgi:hypothetical protein
MGIIEGITAVSPECLKDINRKVSAGNSRKLSGRWTECGIALGFTEEIHHES